MMMGNAPVSVNGIAITSKTTFSGSSKRRYFAVYSNVPCTIELGGASFELPANTPFTPQPVPVNAISVTPQGGTATIMGDNLEVFNPPLPPEPPTFPIDDVVIFGASIMAQSFSSGNQAVTEQLYANKGATVNVHERATSGDDTTTMLTRLPSLISEFQANAARTLFVIHWGGNDVSRNGPYPGGADVMRDNCRQMLQDLKNAGYKVALSNITYREPPSHDTIAYNDGVMNPLIEEFADIALDMHTMTYTERDVWFEVDGVHPNTTGEDLTRKYVVDNTYERFSNLGPIPEPVVWNDVLLSFGQGDVNPDGANKLNASSKLLATVKNIDQSTVPNAEVELLVVDGHSAQGRGNVNDPNDTSLTLTNNIGLTNYCYTQDKALTTSINSGLDPEAFYTVGVTASRDAADVRNNDVTVGGITKVMNATASPAEIVTFTGVLGSDLMTAGISVAPTDITGYAYLSMIRITKE